jgi:hypothetical protein
MSPPKEGIRGVRGVAVGSGTLQALSGESCNKGLRGELSP